MANSISHQLVMKPIKWHWQSSYALKKVSLALLCLLLVMVSMPMAKAQQSALVRAWERGDKAQVSFDFRAQIGFSASASDNKIFIEFEDEVVANLMPIVRLAPNYITGGAISNGNQIILTTKQPLSIVAYPKGERVVLELTADETLSTNRLIGEDFAQDLENQPINMNELVEEEAENQQTQANRPAIPDENRVINQTAVNPGANENVANEASQANRDGGNRQANESANDSDLAISIFSFQDSLFNDESSPEDVFQTALWQDEQNEYDHVVVRFVPPIEPEDELEENNQLGALFLEWPKDIMAMPPYEFFTDNRNVNIRFSSPINLSHRQLREAMPDWMRSPIISTRATGTSILFSATQPIEAQPIDMGNRLALRFLKGEDFVPNQAFSGEDSNAPLMPTPTEVQMARAVIAGDLITKGMDVNRARDILIAAGELDPNKLNMGENKQGQQIVGPSLVNLRFDWQKQVGGAIFRRGEFIWIIFDEPSPIDMAPLFGQGSDVISSLEQLPINGSTVMRLLVPDTRINPALRRETNSWLIDLRIGPIDPAQPVPLDINVNADVGAYLFFPSQEPGEHLRIIDPAAGDIINIITFREPGLGIEEARKYPEFTLIPTVQGVAMETQATDLLFTRADDGMNVSSANGLYISGISPNQDSVANMGFTNNSLFDFIDWGRGPSSEYFKHRQDLLRSISEMPADDLSRARLYLARFYAAHGLGEEAIGVLGMIEKYHPKLAEALPVRALTGVANLLAGRIPEAREIFNNSALDSFREVSLWRGAVLAEEGLLQQASNFFNISSGQLRDYPQPLRGRLGLYIVEAALDNRDIKTANAIIEMLIRESDQMPRHMQGDLQYHHARLLASRSDFELAVEKWQELVKSRDRKNSARSALAYVNVGLKQGFVGLEEALEILNILRYQWRGDEFEMAVMELLGRLQIENGNYAEGFSIYRDALSFYPDDPLADTISSRMNKVFRNLFLEGGADNMSAPKALAFYDTYRELTPPGDEGTQMIDNLIDRLIEVDLLDRAARLLEYQIEHRLREAEKTVAGTKLAMVRLMEERPDLAIKALDLTDNISARGQIVDDRRRLRAQAHFSMNNTDEAIKLLAGDISDEANILRKDIFWSNKRWGDVAKNLQRLAGKPPTRSRQAMPEDKVQHVIDWAIALRLDNDVRGLAYLNQEYGPAMSRTDMADMFEYLTSKEVPTQDLANNAEIQNYISRLTGKDNFNGFLESYQKELF